jgi:hypothetical protein
VLVARGQHRHLFLRRKQQVSLVFAGDALGSGEPVEGIEPETRHIMHRRDVSGEARQAEF